MTRLLLIIGLISCCTLAIERAYAQEPVDEVRPMIGTGGHGHTYPGATVPFGFVQLSPDTPQKGWDGCAGYYFADDHILGFSHTHLSGTGIGDLGDVLVLPITGALNAPGPYQPISAERFQSPFSDENEHAEPGYYRVLLDRYAITAELTATARTGYHRYTFPAAGDRHLLIDLVHGINNHATAASVRIDSDHLVTGQRTTAGWLKNRTIYFALECAQPWKAAGFEKDDQPLPPATAQATGRQLRMHLDFGEAPATSQILLRVGISAVSVDEAIANLRDEATTWDFDAIRATARRQWQDNLNQITIESPDPAIRQTSYTALYHAMLAPTLFDDADGSYLGADNAVHHSSGWNHYTTFSLWDTFRAEHPLLTLIAPQRVAGMVGTLLDMADQTPGNILPTWVLAGHDTGTMTGYHAVSVIADACAKGLLGKIDPHRALRTMLATALAPRNGQDQYAKLGYVPAWPGGHTRGAAKTLEFAYDDSCIAQMAATLGDQQNADLFIKRAQSYRNIFDPKSRFFRGKNVAGQFAPTFDPIAVDFNDYVEANAWQYAFFVPHDVPGMIALYGGPEAFTQRLDEFFTQPSFIHHYIPDISGLIGQYAHGNEPCHHIAYLYALVGQQNKTARLVRQILQMQYDNTPAGICGNDDCGQMSAWYVWSAIGLYPLNPASGVYIIGSPIVSRATIQLNPAFYPGHTFTIVAHDVSNQNFYVQSATLNGKPLDHPWITQADVANGGTLDLQMGILPTNWGTP